MSGKDLLKEEIVTIIDDDSVYYFLTKAGPDMAVFSYDKNTKEVECLYSLIGNDHVWDLLDDDSVKKYVNQSDINRILKSII